MTMNMSFLSIGMHFLFHVDNTVMLREMFEQGR